MSDEQTNGASKAPEMANTETGEAAAAPRGAAVPIQIHAQYIKDLSFENPNVIARGTTGAQQEQPSVNINIGVKAEPTPQNGLYEVVLTVRTQGKRGGEDLFLIELDYAGVFSFTGLPQEQLGVALYVEAPRFLFPYARSIIGDLSGQGLMPPLYLQPIDFMALLRQEQERRQAAGKAETPTS